MQVGIGTVAVADAARAGLGVNGELASRGHCKKVIADAIEARLVEARALGVTNNRAALVTKRAELTAAAAKISAEIDALPKLEEVPAA